MKYFSFLFIFVLAFSCESDISGITETEVTPSTKSASLSSAELAQIHNNVISELNSEYELTESAEHDFNNQLAENVEKINSSNHTKYISNSNFSYEMEVLEFIAYNESDANLHELIQSNYSLNSDQARLVFIGYEAYKVALAEYKGDESKRDIDGVGCALAVAGTVMSTVGALTVTTGFGLGLWVAGKVLATVSVVYGCT